ncbi:hypothetical protein [Hahella ganghwensis]|uniref:hypothetical protein n=1 Tax=Hahella ganghwensis TaxID=286420 RepID=UPI00035E1333|nr:hypothetical protein [Hahella ganghwensis]
MDGAASRFFGMQFARAGSNLVPLTLTFLLGLATSELHAADVEGESAQAIDRIIETPMSVERSRQQA